MTPTIWDDHYGSRRMRARGSCAGHAGLFAYALWSRLPLAKLTRQASHQRGHSPHALKAASPIRLKPVTTNAGANITRTTCITTSFRTLPHSRHYSLLTFTYTVDNAYLTSLLHSLVNHCMKTNFIIDFVHRQPLEALLGTVDPIALAGEVTHAVEEGMKSSAAL